MAIVQPTTKTFEPLPTDDFIQAKVADIKVEPNRFEDDGSEKASVQFDITEPGLEGRKVWRTYGYYWPNKGTKPTRLYEFVSRLDVRAMPGEPYDLDALIGKEVRLLVEDYTKADGTTGQRVANVKPIIAKAMKTVQDVRDEKASRAEDPPF